MDRLVTDLRDALSRVPVANSNRVAGRRRNRRRRAPRALPALPQPPQPRRNRRRRRRGNSSAAFNVTEGELRLSKSELYATVTTDAKGAASGSKHLHPDHISLLGSLATRFERLRWLGAKISWRPAVGTTQGGLITYGIDWDLTKGATTREKIAVYSPSATNAIWADTSSRPMVLAAHKLQTRPWYTPYAGDNNLDKEPGLLVYAASGPSNTVLGEFWIEYQVILSGTVAA